MKRLIAVALVFAGCASTPTMSAPSAPVPPASAAARDAFALTPHERVDYHIQRFTTEKRTEFASYLQRKGEYETMISEKLRRKGMPQELIYLAMIESGFNPQAHSAANAKGIWQLIPDTARRWGLKVDDTVDERLDAEKSTDAALSYLAYLYNRFGSWYLAAAAYNTGENRIARILSEATGAETGTDADYYRIWDRLPGETRDFVPVMVAAAMLDRDRARYGF